MCIPALCAGMAKSAFGVVWNTCEPAGLVSRGSSMTDNSRVLGCGA